MVALASFATPQAALDALDTTTTATVFIGGTTVEFNDWSAQFGVDQGMATATITMSLPRPANVVANAEVEIQGGHNDLVGTLFSGRIPRWSSSMTLRGDVLTIRPVGWCSLLNYRQKFDLTYAGPITLSALFDSLCARVGIPSYQADEVTDPTGAITISLGGNPNVDEGRVTIPSSQTPLSFLTNAVEPYGYRIYDTPNGTVRLSRVSGAPAGDPAVIFREGVHLHSASSEYDITGITNYWDIIGQTYEDELGATVPIRAFPSEVPADPLIPVNEGVAYRDYRNSLITTQQNAEIVRQVREIDNLEPSTPVKWDAVALPGVSPGDCVEVDCETVEANARYWLMNIDFTDTGRGFTSSYDGWLGSGEALPAGNDRTTIEVQDAAIHLGDETLSHYAVPTPSGDSDSWPITIPERASAINVRGIHHGTNSQIVGGAQTDLEVTKWAIYLPGEDPDDDDIRPQTSGNMPVVNENLSQQLDYTNLANWAPFAINLRSLDAGDYTLWLIAGVKAGIDDFEVQDVYLEIFGINEPVIIPGEDV